MRVLLIYPNLDCPIGVNHGLSMISGVLKAAGHETRLIHVNDKLFDVPTPEQLVERVRAYDPGVIGFSVMTQQYAWAVEAAAALRVACPEIPTVVGGVHCTMVPDEATAEGHFGEGELAFRELVDRLERGQEILSTPNMRFPARSRFNRNLTPINNPVDSFPDLADIAPNDYELFDMERIVASKNGWFGVLTSRGCPYKCTYCFNKEIVDRYVEDGAAKGAKDYLRHYPVPRIMEELRGLVTRYPDINTILLDDDLFTLNRTFVRDFCEAYKASGIGRPFVLNAHVQVFDDEMAFMLADAGCRIVKYGLESGSQRLRKEVLWRYMKNETMKTAFWATQNYGILPGHGGLHHQRGPRPHRSRARRRNGQLLRRELPPLQPRVRPLHSQARPGLPLVGQRPQRLGLRPLLHGPRGGGRVLGRGDLRSREGPAARPRSRPQRGAPGQGHSPLLDPLHPRDGRRQRVRPRRARANALSARICPRGIHPGRLARLRPPQERSASKSPALGRFRVRGPKAARSSLRRALGQGKGPRWM